MENTSEFHYGEYVWLRRWIVKISYLLNPLEFLHDLAYSYDYPVFFFFYIFLSFHFFSCLSALSEVFRLGEILFLRGCVSSCREMPPPRFAIRLRQSETSNRKTRKTRKKVFRCSKRRSIFCWRKAHDAWIAHACVSPRRIRVINIFVRTHSAAISLANIVIRLVNSGSVVRTMESTVNRLKGNFACKIFSQFTRYRDCNYAEIRKTYKA